MRDCGSVHPTPSPPPKPHHTAKGEVWSKPLQETAYSQTKGWSALQDHHAIALLNVGDEPVQISAHLPTILRLWEQEGAGKHLKHQGESAASLVARDVWQNRSLGMINGGMLNATVGPHEVRLFRVWRAVDRVPAALSTFEKRHFLET